MIIGNAKEVPTVLKLRVLVEAVKIVLDCSVELNFFA